MTLEEIKARVAEIAENVDDPEIAHSMEDDLYIAVLKAIAEGDHVEYVEQLADAALEARHIDFPRWCA